MSRARQNLSLCLYVSVACGFLALAAAAPAAAQTPAPRPAGTEFLSRFDFAFGLEHLVSDDQRFVWDARFGGELDLVDYGRGRLTFVAQYETVLGSEYQPFDPLQSIYTIEGALSARTGPVEVAGVLHHVSRHLGDRSKRDPIDRNMVGGRLLGGAVTGRTDWRGRVDLRGAVQKTFVDYRWEIDGDVRARVRLSPRAAVITGGGVRVLGVDGSRNRGTQYGGRGEGGVRLEGPNAAVELFVAAERRIDPYLLEFSTATWLTAGFRLVSR